MKIKSLFAISFLTLVFSFYAQALNISWALSARQGDPSYMEDTFSVRVPFTNGQQDGFWSIYDGHGGKDSANYIASQLPVEFAKEGPYQMPDYKILPGLKNVFATVNANLKSSLSKTSLSGSTASVMYLKNNKAYFAWVGDSRIMLFKKDGKISFISREHKPTDPEERKRINETNTSDSGIFIDEERGRLKVPYEDQFLSLAVSRSFGDFDFNPVVTVDPETRFELLKEGDIVVIASDGMWDEIEPANDQNNLEEDENPGVVNIVQGILQKKQLANMAQVYLALPVLKGDGSDTVVDTSSQNAPQDLQFVARFLRDQAYEKAAEKYEDGGDNISVLVIRVEE